MIKLGHERKVRSTITFTFLSTRYIFRSPRISSGLSLNFRGILMSAGDNGQVKVTHNLKIHLVRPFHKLSSRDEDNFVI